MSAKPFRDRLLPYKILKILQNDQLEWVELVKTGTVRLYTGDAARVLKYRTGQIREAIEWLKKYNLVKSIKKKKKGVYIVELLVPQNLQESTEL